MEYANGLKEIRVQLLLSSFGIQDIVRTTHNVFMSMLKDGMYMELVIS